MTNQTKCIAFRDNFAYLTSKVDGEAGLVRVDLSTIVIPNSLFFPWAWDLIATGTTTTASQVAFFGNSDRAAFTYTNSIIVMRDVGITTHIYNKDVAEGFGSNSLGCHIGCFHGYNTGGYTPVVAGSFLISAILP